MRLITRLVPVLSCSLATRANKNMKYKESYNGTVTFGFVDQGVWSTFCPCQHFLLLQLNPCFLQRHYPPGKGRQGQCPPLHCCIELLLRGMVGNGTERTRQQWVEHGGLGTGWFTFFGLFPIRATRQRSLKPRNVALGACIQFENPLRFSLRSLRNIKF